MMVTKSNEMISVRNKGDTTRPRLNDVAVFYAMHHDQAGGRSQPLVEGGMGNKSRHAVPGGADDALPVTRALHAAQK